MRTVETEIELDGTLQTLSIPNHLFLEIENTSGGNLGIKVNGGAERTYEAGSSYKTPIFENNKIFTDTVQVRGVNGQSIYCSYILPQ